MSPEGRELGSRGVGRAALFLLSGYPGAILILIVGVLQRPAERRKK